MDRAKNVKVEEHDTLEDGIRKRLEFPPWTHVSRNKCFYDEYSTYSPLQLETYDNQSTEVTEVDDETELRNAFESRISEIMESVYLKSAAKRTAAVADLCKEFSYTYCPEFLSTRVSTMTNIVLKGLRKGDCEEQAVSATLAGILSIQLGHTEEGVQMYSDLKMILVTMLLDTTASPVVREKVALSLAVSCFMTDSDDLEMQFLMDKLQEVFSCSYLTEDGSTPSISHQLSHLIQHALITWCFLLSSLSNEALALEIINRHLPDIIGMLESTDVDMRIAAGEALATMYELARKRDSEFQWEDEEGLFETLRQLATDRQIFRAKKDRKIQKPFFRNILKAVKDQESPHLSVNYAVGQELLVINSWSTKRLYESLCALLGSGLNKHLLNNPQIRDIFGLMAPIPKSLWWTGPSTQFMQPRWHNQNDKIRTKAMRKVRDKRCDYSE